MKSLSLVLRPRWIQLLLFIFSLIPTSYAQTASLGIHRDLAALIDESEVVFHGRVSSAKVEPDPQYSNLTTVLVTLQVEDVLKGNVPKTFSFRQYVWDIRSQYTSAGYHKGQELLLFLRRPSPNGLTSPAGLQQGKFEIHHDATGRAFAVNGDANLGLFQTLSVRAKARRAVLPASSLGLMKQNSGPVPLKDLKDVVKALVGPKQ